MPSAAGTPHRRSIRPAGAGWLKSRIDGKVTIHNGQFVTAVKPARRPRRGHLRRRRRDIVDHVLLGTGIASTWHATLSDGDR
jgi:hypothetical protein